MADSLPTELWGKILTDYIEPAEAATGAGKRPWTRHWEREDACQLVSMQRQQSASKLHHDAQLHRRVGAFLRLKAVDQLDGDQPLQHRSTPIFGGKLDRSLIRQVQAVHQTAGMQRPHSPHDVFATLPLSKARLRTGASTARHEYASPNLRPLSSGALSRVPPRGLCVREPF